MTTQEINNIGENKIITIYQEVGLLANSMKFKVFKYVPKIGPGKRQIIVVTREGLLRFMGDAQMAMYAGKKGIHFQSFNTANQASNYIKKINN
jgi:hypothetical protein